MKSVLAADTRLQGPAACSLQLSLKEIHARKSTQAFHACRSAMGHRRQVKGREGGWEGGKKSLAQGIKHGKEAKQQRFDGSPLSACSAKASGLWIGARSLSLRRSQEEPGEARKSQKEPWGASTPCQGNPGPGVLCVPIKVV